MRIVAIVSLVFILFSCQKEDSPRAEVLEGSWEWVECVGGISMEVVSSAEDAGTMITLEFEGNRMRRIENKAIVFDLRFSFDMVETSSGTFDLIRLENGDSFSYYFEEGRLFMWEGLQLCEYK